MKKFFAIAAIAAMTLSFMACEPEEEPTPNPGPGTEQGGENNGGNNNGGENNGGDQGETPAPAPVEFDCLKGSDYYVLFMGESAYSTIASKVVADLRTDDVNTHLWVWDATATGVDPVGPNYYGDVEGYMSFAPAAGWYGLAYCTYNKERLDKLVNVTLNPSDYVLHIAMKSQDYGTHIIKMYSGGQEFAVEIGAAGDNRKYQLPRDGEWYEFEIPMTGFTNKGLLWNSADWANADPEALTGGHNTVAFVGVGDPGYILGSLNYDALFIYKPAK